MMYAAARSEQTIATLTLLRTTWNIVQTVREKQFARIHPTPELSTFAGGKIKKSSTYLIVPSRKKSGTDQNWTVSQKVLYR